MPIRIGMPTKKTIVVPCIVNSWLNVSGPDELVARHEELPAHQQGLDAADDQEDHGHEDVHDADLLVIDGGHPVVQRPSSRRLGRRLLRRAGVWFGNGHAHVCSHDSMRASTGNRRSGRTSLLAQAEGRHQAARLDLSAGRAIQSPQIRPRVLATMPEASVCRLIRCVRSGA